VLVCDTGPLLALLDGDDPEHQRCVDLVTRLDEDLVVPSPVLVELDYWVRKGLGPEVWQTFVEDVERGAYRILEPTVVDIARAATLESEYHDLPLGYVDASVVALLERTGETRVATLDRRHFSIIRPTHCDALELLP
jgi:predicted nucleic acid-binding protein